MFFMLQYENPSAESTEHHNLNNVDFVLAYRRHRKARSKNDMHDNRTDELERRRFYCELRANGILVNVDDDPTVSINIVLP